MNRSYTVLLCLFFLTLYHSPANAQYTEVGQNSFTSNLYGPAVVSTTVDTAFNRHAYIYRNTVLGDLTHGDTIRSLEFYKNGTGVITGNTRFRIFLNMSDTGDFGFGRISWTSESQKSGCVLVYENNLANIIRQREGFYRFDFNRSDGKFAFDTTRGRHLKILVEFVQYDTQATSLPWSYENNVTVPEFISSNETKYIIGRGQPLDSTNNSNVRKPYIRINFPRYDHNFNVHNVYALGKVPRRMGIADTIKAMVSNDGLKTAYNTKFYLNVSGAGTYLDSITVDSLVPYQRRLVRFANYIPKTDGREDLVIVPQTDNYPTRDTGRMARLVNVNVYAHTNPFRTMDGGVGFNNETGDFLAKFYSDTGNYINQIAVEFFSNNLEFQLGIWEPDSNGLPGKELFMSDTLVTAAGAYILPVLPRVKVGRAFYAGIRQLSQTNLAFGFQWETPIRPDVFYFTAPAQNTQWVPFSPGYDFNFNIQPRIQVANDVAVVRAVEPEDGEVIELSVTDSLAPRAMVHNFGFKNQDAPFSVVCYIQNQFGQRIYESTRSIKLNAGDSLEVVFDSTFRLYNNGPNTMYVYTQLSTDNVSDNDTLKSEFEIVISHDVSVDRFFSPIENETIQMNRDSVWPVVRVLNNGVKQKNVTKVNLRVFQGTYLISDQVRFVNLDPLSSEIVSFDTILLNRHGTVTFEASVYQSVDSFRSNDTIRTLVNVIKDDDLAMLKVIRPLDQSVYLTGSVFKPFVDFRNVGRVSQDSVWTYCAVYNSASTRIYKDSSMHSIIQQSTKQALFRDFTVPLVQDTLTAVFWVRNPEDQDPTNDTLKSRFYAAIGNDLAGSKFSTPTPDTLVETGVTSFTPKATFINQGLIDIVDHSGYKYTCRITKLTGTTRVVYEDSITYTGGTASFGDSIPITWNKSFSLDSSGTYEVSAWHNHPKDELPENDTITARFSAARLNSIILDQVFQPQNKVYEVNTSVISPEIRILNNGLQDIAQFTSGKMIIWNGQDTVYEDTYVIGGLKSLEGRIVKFDNDFAPTDTGIFNAVVWLENSADVNKSDDTVRLSFKVIKKLDVAPVMPVYPAQGDTLVFQRTYKPTATFTNYGDSAIPSSFSVSFHVFDGTSLIYNSNKSVQGLNPGEKVTVAFDSSFTAWFKGTGTSMVVTRYGFDQDVTNDTLITQFTILDPAGIGPDNTLHGVSVYPNPFDRSLHISTENTLISGKYTITVYSATGVKRKEMVMRESKAEIMLEDLARGVYFVKVTSDDGRSTVIPVVRQ